jgi:hypothetical protein
MPTRKNGFYEAAMEMSSELRHINVQMDRDIREYGMGRMRFIPAGKPKTLYQLVADNPYLLIMEFQKRVNAITLLAAKSKAEDMGLSGKDVVQYAESVVRTTQSGGGLKDLAGIQSGSEITKALTPFYTYFSVLYNRLSEAGRKDLIQGFVKGNTAADKMRGAHEFATNYVWLILAPVIIENLMMGDREGDEDLLNDLMWDQLLYPMTAIPLARDIASSMVLGFEPETPMTGALDSVIKGTKGTYDLMTGEGNWTDVRNAMRALTTTTGLPFFAAAKVAEAVQQDDPLSVARGVAFGVPYHDRRNMD